MIAKTQQGIYCEYRVVSNFGDGGSGESEIRARARNFEETLLLATRLFGTVGLYRHDVLCFLEHCFAHALKCLDGFVHLHFLCEMPPCRTTLISLLTGTRGVATRDSGSK